MIYLCSNTPNINAFHLKLCEIYFYKFNLDLYKFDALVFSSKNSIFSLKKNLIPANANLPVFTIGEASAIQARNYGFIDVFVAQTSYADEFVKQIVHKLQNKKTLVLRAKEPIQDIAGILRKFGVDVEEQIAYENRILKHKKMQFDKNSIFIFTSPKNVEAFLQNFTWENHFKAIAIGNSTAQALNSFCKPLISQKQNIDECIRLAKNLL